MTVFGGKGKYWLIIITLMVIIGLVWQLIAADEQTGFAMHTEIITSSDFENSIGTMHTSSNELDGITGQESDSGASVDSDNAAADGGTGSSTNQNQNINQKEIETTDDNKEELPVYLVGAVMKPGIYTICPGVYLYQLVDLAGGLTAEAASEQINLAARIYQNQLIRIPTKEEMLQNPDMQYVSEEKPEIDNAGSDDNLKNNQSKLININTADPLELEQLPGIGSATALSITSYRQKSGRFNKIEDIMKVSGIKESRFETIRHLITVN